MRRITARLHISNLTWCHLLYTRLAVLSYFVPNLLIGLWYSAGMGPGRIAVIVAVVAVGIGASYAVSPYFTESTVDEPMPENILVQPSADSELGMPNTADNNDAATSVAASASYAGTFVGVGDGIHDAGGHAYTIPLKDGESVLRLEDFYSTNGPGLRVYLATDTTASDYRSLGDLKANRGNQNYAIPSDIDLEEYDHVLIWCEPFSVLFGSAELSASR